MHKLNQSTIYENVSLSHCWRDQCKKNCSFFSWNSDKKTCSISNENTEICKTPRGSECSSQMIEDMSENFTTVRANSCEEKIMTKNSDCKWGDDLLISMDITYRLKLVFFPALLLSDC